MEKYENVLRYFKSYGGILTRRQLNEFGVNYYALSKLLSEGYVESIKRGIYKLKNKDVNQFYEVQKIVSKGVFSLHSSALFFNLSTYIPSEYHVAIPRKNKVVLPNYPPINLYYWEKDQYSLGQVKIKKDDIEIVTYNKEKTVCDFVKFRNRVGFDLTKEVLKEYLKLEDRNISLLVEYSKKLKIRSVLDQYLEVLI